MKQIAAVIRGGVVGGAHADALRGVGNPERRLLGSTKRGGAGSTKTDGGDTAHAPLGRRGAGGAATDIGKHCLDLLMWLTGKKVMDVCADLATLIPVRRKPRGRVETFKKADATAYDEIPMSTDDYASVLLHFEGDLRGVMSVSQVSSGHKAKLAFEINGSEGSL